MLISQLAVQQADSFIRTGETGADEKQSIDCVVIDATNADKYTLFGLEGYLGRLMAGGARCRCRAPLGSSGRQAREPLRRRVHVDCHGRCRGIRVTGRDRRMHGCVLLDRGARLLRILHRAIRPHPQQRPDGLQEVEQHMVVDALRELEIELQVGFDERGRSSSDARILAT